MSSYNKVTFGSLLAGITREGADEALRDAFVSVTAYSNGSRPSDAGKYSVYIVAPALIENEDGVKMAAGELTEQTVGLSWFAKSLPGMKQFNWSGAPSTQLGLIAAHRLGYRVTKDGAEVPAPAPKIKPVKGDSEGEVEKDTRGADKPAPRRSKGSNRDSKRVDETEGKGGDEIVHAETEGQNPFRYPA